jgi:hypothetical protein
VQSSSRLLRPPEQRRRPIRFCKVKRKNKDIIDSREKANELSEMSADSGKRFRRTEQQKKKRRERAKGPWFCSLCEREPFGSIAGFRNHVIVAHGKDCSWNGLISDPRDNKHRDDLIAAVRNSQRHRRNKRRRCDAAGTSEQNVEPDVETSSSFSSSPAAVSTSSDVGLPPVIRCCRVRLSSPKPVNCESVVAPVPEASLCVAADTARNRQSLPLNRRRSRETQTPVRGQLHLPDDVTMKYLIDHVYSNPGVSVNGLTRLIQNARPRGWVPDERDVVMELVLHGIVLSAGRLAQIVNEQHDLVANLPRDSNEADYQRIQSDILIKALLYRPLVAPPARPTPLDVSALPAEIDVAGGGGRPVVAEGEMLGHSPASPAIEVIIDGVPGSHIWVSDSE